MQLKHFFVFLLVLLISVADCNIYSQKSTSNYYQSSKIVAKYKLCLHKTKHIIYNQNLVSYTYFLTFFFPKIDVKTVFQKRIQHTIKLQKQLYKNIASTKFLHTFLTVKTTSGNFNSLLYKA